MYRVAGYFPGIGPIFDIGVNPVTFARLTTLTEEGVLGKVPYWEEVANSPLAGKVHVRTTDPAWFANLEKAASR